MKKYINNRRQFIKNLSMASLGLASMPSSIFKLKTWAAAAANNSNLSGGYKALVCFYMFGGNDGFNMLVPKGDEEHGAYKLTRSNLALEKNELLAINPVDNQNMEFGLHPNLSGLQSLFENEKLSFLCNIGTKLFPDTNKQNYIDQKDLPLSLFSHSDQTQQWQTGRVNERGGFGWAGRVADLMGSTNTNTNISMNVSIDDGTAFFLRGENTNGFSISSRAVQTMPGHNPISIPNSYTGLRTAAIDSMFDHDYHDPFYNSFNSIYKNGIESNLEFLAALNNFEAGGGLTTSFSTSEAGFQFSANLKRVAQTIAVAPSLGFERQIFFVHVGGFDNHKDLLTDHANRMKQVDTGLREFYAALEELDATEKVVTFSMSDFGRTLTSNGSSGTDHAWGSNAIVMGGPVIGRSLFGDYPELILNSDIDVGKGTLIPSLSSDLYCAELAHWFGVPKTDLDDIFPNLKNFYSTSSNDLPLGFLTV